MARLFPMPHRLAWAAVLAAVLGFGPASAAAVAQPAPVEPWGQFQGGPGHPGTTNGGPAPPYREVWRFSAPRGAVSGAVVSGDVAITVGERGVYGIDVANGKLLWTLIRNGGPLAMPAVGGSSAGTVLVFSDDAESTGTALVGVGLEDMSELWRTPLDAATRSGVTVDGGTAFVGDSKGTLYAIDLASGELRWSASTVGQIPAPPSVGAGNIHAVGLDTDGRRVEVLAVDSSDGSTAWRFSAPVAGAAASASAAGEGVVVAGFADRFVRALEPVAGEERWTSLLNSVPFPFTSPALAGEDVYVADVAGGLYRLNGATGERIWGYQLNDLVVRSSPVVSGSAALLGLNDGRLVAVDVESGHLVWQSPPQAGLMGAIAVTPDRLIVVTGGRDAGLVAFEHDPDARLVDVPSPTELDLGQVLSRFGIASALLFVALFVPAMAFARRVGPPALPPETGEPEPVSDPDEGP